MTMLDRPLRLGTRGSPLALAQTRLAAARYRARFPDAPAPEIVPIRTTGDRVTDRPLADVGGKGLFAKEIEEALIAGDIDAAVHSLKDLETHLPDGTAIAACLPRADPRDVLISRDASGIDTLPRNARFGTSSLRRAAQIKALRPDVEITFLRGNVGTRLDKVRRGEAEATMLAAAGLARLEIETDLASPLEPEVFLPAACQGIVAIECRAEDEAVRGALIEIDDAETHAVATAERSTLAALDGTCATPIAALAVRDGDGVWLRALVGSPDGAWLHRAERRGAWGDAAALGAEAGAELRGRAPPGFFEPA